jgi:transcriptional regulator with XRE-family HTH domain
VQFGLSREQLAFKSGLSSATIYRAEAGQRRPNRSTLVLLCGALALDIDDLEERADSSIAARSAS